MEQNAHRLTPPPVSPSLAAPPPVTPSLAAPPPVTPSLPPPPPVTPHCLIVSRVFTAARGDGDAWDGGECPLSVCYVFLDSEFRVRFAP